MLLVVLGLAGPAAAAVDPAAAAACGPDYVPIVLCGGEEVLCVPEGCGDFGCISCCPPCGPAPCGPDPNSPQCQGASCACGPSCDCFTTTIDRSKMAPLLGVGPLVLLTLALLSTGLLVARKRLRTSSDQSVQG